MRSMAGNRFKPRSIVVGAVLLILAGTISLWLCGWAIRKEASSLLADLTALRVGESSSEDAGRVVQRHRRVLDKIDCRNATCEYNFIITNRWLSSLRLEPTAQFRAGLTVENGVVIHIYAGLLRAMDIYPTFGASAGLVEEYAEMPQRFALEQHYGFPTPVGKPYLRVVLDRHAGAVQRQHAFEFSFKCLTKPGGGCNLSCDYLPSAWRDWREDLRTTGFPMSDFDEAYPKNSRCK